MLCAGELRTELSRTRGSRGTVDNKKLSRQQGSAFQNMFTHKARQPLAWCCLWADFKSILRSRVCHDSKALIPAHYVEAWPFPRLGFLLHEMGRNPLAQV